MNSLTRRVAHRVIRFLPSPWALRSRTWLAVAEGAIGPELSQLDEYFPGERRGVAIDVGANNGMTSLLFSRVFGRVHSIEPNPTVLAQWRAAAPANVVVWNVAISDESREAELKVPILNGIQLSGWASLDTPHLAKIEGMHTLPVSCRRLDEMQFNELRVDFIKIDVEGHELAVLRGAEEMLVRDQPWLVIETRDQTRQAIVELLHNLGYREFNLQARLGLLGPTQDLVMAPNEG